MQNEEEMIKWTTEIRPLKSLKEHSRNPRVLTKAQHRHLKKSLEKFGLCEKPIINLDGTIIGGHQRLKILKELGYKEIIVNVPSRSLTESEIDELNIRLNKNTGDWDWDILANQWDIKDLMDWGFNEKDLELYLDELNDESDIKEEEEACKCPNCGKKMKKKRNIDG